MIPRGYIRLTSTYDGKPILLSARELVVCHGDGLVRAGQRHPHNCTVGPVLDMSSYWTVAETFEEVQAALVIAQGGAS